MNEPVLPRHIGAYLQESPFRVIHSMIEAIMVLEKHNQVKRTEVSTNHVLLYLEQVTNVTQSYSFTVEQDVVVQDLKPALVKVYDYYETDEFAVEEYNAPCSTGEIKTEA